MLTEVRLYHPVLPLLGVIDLIKWENGRITILDFKTGQSSADHERQLQVYALLWYRETGTLPDEVEIRYLGTSTKSDVSQSALLALEDELAAQIQLIQDELGHQPASATSGPGCRYCDVRQFCPTYWSQEEF